MIEVLMVVALIATFAAIVGARIGGGFGIAIGGEGRVMAAELRAASQRARATGRTQRLVVNLDAQAFRLEEEVEIQELAEDMPQALRDLLRPPAPRRHFVPVSSTAGTWRWLGEESVFFDGVDTRQGSFEEGVVAIGFGPDGGADRALIRLSDEHENRLGVRVDAFTGGVQLLDEEELDDQDPLAWEYGGASQAFMDAEPGEPGDDPFEDEEAIFEEPDDSDEDEDDDVLE
jgi:hypothetical protein